MKLKDYVPQKVVAADLCVSIATLWRARLSNLPGFPKPTIIQRQVFWKKTELPALEDALMQFKGRKVFDTQRANAKRVAAIEKQIEQKPKPKKRGHRKLDDQQSLF